MSIKHDRLAVAKRAVAAALKELEWVEKNDPDRLGNIELESYPLAVGFKWKPWDLKLKPALGEGGSQ